MQSAPIHWNLDKQPLDTLGRPLRDLRISVMDRCNFRCPYCMPADASQGTLRFLPSAEWLNFDEIARLARLAAELGVEKIRLTGGEPLLRPGLADLVHRLRIIPGVNDLAMTTNGVLLAEQAQTLKDAGLDRVTISLDSLDDIVFVRMNGGRPGKQRVLDGIAAAAYVGLTPVKVNTVVQRSVNDHTVLDLLQFFRGTGVIVRFIEYMDVGTRNQWQFPDVVPSAELAEKIGQRWSISPVSDEDSAAVARHFVYDDGMGEIGFVSSVTQPFCGSCVRARISSDGILYTCLFAESGTDLKSAIRSGASDSELREIVSTAWSTRDDRYSELRVNRPATRLGKVEMHYIGG